MSAPSARTGLGPLELGILDTLDLLGGDADGGMVRCSDVLAALEARLGIGARYAWPAMVDLGVPWRVHLRLVELMGNAGTQSGSPPAEPRHVEARLSPLGTLALAAEQGRLGPVPMGLIEGTLYRDGAVPSFAPASVVSALLAGRTGCGPPVLPTGGTVEGDVEGLLAGRPVRLRLGSTIRYELDRLVITEVPLGVSTDSVLESIAGRLQPHEHREGHHLGLHRRADAAGVLDVRDDTSARNGLRIVVDIERSANVPRVLEWLHGIWPVTIEADLRLPAPQAERLAGWDRGDGTGLRALSDELKDRFDV